jgi:hypothetical protein
MNTITVDSKTQFIENVQKWVKLDSQLKYVNEKIKTIRDMKSQLSENICEYVEKNNIKTKINLTDGQLLINEKKIYSPLSFGYIEECLEKIIDDSDQIDFIINYLRDNREVDYVKEIRRTNTK